MEPKETGNTASSGSVVVFSLIFVIALALLMSGVGGFLMLSDFLTLVSPLPDEARNGNALRLGYFALMFFGGLAILVRLVLLTLGAMGGRATVDRYMREAVIYGSVMLLALGTSCWLVAEWARQLGQR